MNHLRLVLINLRRHRIRTLIGVSGIALGVAAMFAVTAIVRGAIGMFERILSADTEMLVFERSVSDLFFSVVDDVDFEQISQMPEVAAAHPVLFGLVSSPGHPVLTCFGVRRDDPRLQRAEWVAGNPEDFGRVPGGIAVGVRAAEFLQASIGHPLQVGNNHYPVIGILRTETGFEDGGLFLPLPLAREHLHRDGASSVVTIKLRDRSLAGAFRRRLEETFPYLTALENSEFSRSYSQFRILRATSWAVGGVAFLLGGLSVANTMVLSVFVRIRELAILKSCGFSHRQVGSLVVGESLLIALTGAVLGTAIGFTCVLVLKELPWLQGYVTPHFEWPVMAGIMAIAIATGIAGAAYPAWFAMKIEPARALRYE